MTAVTPTSPHLAFSSSKSSTAIAPAAAKVLRAPARTQPAVNLSNPVTYHQVPAWVTNGIKVVAEADPTIVSGVPTNALKLRAQYLVPQLRTLWNQVFPEAIQFRNEIIQKGVPLPPAPKTKELHLLPEYGRVRGQKKSQPQRSVYRRFVRLLSLFRLVKKSPKPTERPHENAMNNPQHMGIDRESDVFFWRANGKDHHLRLERFQHNGGYKQTYWRTAPVLDYHAHYFPKNLAKQVSLKITIESPDPFGEKGMDVTTEAYTHNVDLDSLEDKHLPKVNPAAAHRSIKLTIHNRLDAKRVQTIRQNGAADVKFPTKSVSVSTEIKACPQNPNSDDSPPALSLVVTRDTPTKPHITMESLGSKRSYHFTQSGWIPKPKAGGIDETRMVAADRTDSKLKQAP